MADNTTITPGSGATIAADDISSVLYQRNKIALGADGVNDGDVSDSNPMPIKQGDDNLTVTALASLAYSSLSSSHATLKDLTGVNARAVSIWNDTNSALIISFNGGTNDHEILSPGERREIGSGSIGGTLAGAVVKAKVASGWSTPSAGAVYLTAYSGS